VHNLYNESKHNILALVGKANINFAINKTIHISLKEGIPSLWPIYVGERKTTFAKAYGINRGAIGNVLRNIVRT
jgi:hypothetical protein